MSNAFLPPACREVKLWQTISFHCLARIKVPHVNKRMAPAAEEFTPRSGCSPSRAGCATQGAAGGEAKPHIPPWTIPCALAHLFHQHCSAEPIPSVPVVPLRAQDGTGGFRGTALGFCPPHSPQLYTLGRCLCSISCVSKPPFCPRNSHNLLCVFLAQKRLIHSLKQINYFCYLEKKKKKKKINPLELVGLTFNCVHNAVKQICSEPEQKSSHGVRNWGLQYLPVMSAVGSAI